MNTLNVMLGTLNLVSASESVNDDFLCFLSLNLRKSSFSVLCIGQALLAEQESKDSGGASIAEQVLSIMEIILDEANAEISEDKVSV